MNTLTNDYLHNDLEDYVESLEDGSVKKATFVLIHTLGRQIFEAGGGIVHINMVEGEVESTEKSVLARETLANEIEEATRQLFLTDITGEGNSIYMSVASFVGRTLDHEGIVEAVSISVPSRDDQPEFMTNLLRHGEVGSQA